MRLLLAEDDMPLGRATCVGLMQEGYAVDWVTNGNQVLSALRMQKYDCVLLDLGLPELKGEDVLRNVRAGRDRTPMIVITARAMVGDRVGLLDEGADDYLVKPFDLDELAARIRAVVRRSQSSDESGELTHGPLQLMPVSRTALWRGTIVQLTSKEFWVLEALVRRRNRTVSRQQLEEALYGWGDEIGSNAVEVHVHHLRKKLHQRLIITVRGMGYQLCPVDKLDEEGPASVLSPLEDGA